METRSTRAGMTRRPDQDPGRRQTGRTDPCSRWSRHHRFGSCRPGRPAPGSALTPRSVRSKRLLIFRTGRSSGCRSEGRATPRRALRGSGAALDDGAALGGGLSSTAKATHSLDGHGPGPVAPGMIRAWSELGAEARGIRHQDLIYAERSRAELRPRTSTGSWAASISRSMRMGRSRTRMPVAW